MKKEKKVEKEECGEIQFIILVMFLVTIIVMLVMSIISIKTRRIPLEYKGLGFLTGREEVVVRALEKEREYLREQIKNQEIKEKEEKEVLIEEYKQIGGELLDKKLKLERQGKRELGYKNKGYIPEEPFKRELEYKKDVEYMRYNLGLISEKELEGEEKELEREYNEVVRSRIREVNILKKTTKIMGVFIIMVTILTSVIYKVTKKAKLRKKGEENKR